MQTGPAAKATWNSPDSLLAAALGLFAFAAVFSVTLVELALFLALAVLLYKNYRERSLGALLPAVAGHPLALPWLIYLAACLLTALTAYYPAKGFGQLNSDFLKFLCLFTLLAAVRKEHLPRLGAIYVLGALLFVFSGLTEVAKAALEGWEKLPRANAFMNAIRFGEIMTVAFIYIVCRVLLPAAENFRREGLFYKLAAPAVFAGIILSQARGAFLALLAALLTMFVFAAGTRKKLLALAGLMLAAGVAASIFVPAVRQRLAAIVNVDRTEDTTYSSPSTAINIRFELWNLGLTMFRAHPVLGVGPDNVKKVFTKFHPEPIAYEKTWGSLHNLYIHQAAERGVVGLGALLLLFGSLFAFAVKRFRAAPGAHTLWALCVLPAFFVMNFTEISFQHVHTSFAIFLALAFAAAAEKETA
ncbi:MAG: O-antigen ligase family protein [Elusimicrobiales bacterium]|nr:O-antigen ligase family protein [Elusimicrobiales bacterium]